MVIPDGSQVLQKHLFKTLLGPTFLGLETDRWVDAGWVFTILF